MVDNRADTRRDLRTPLARVKGLGAAGHGAEAWWLHRMTAVSNIPLIVAFVIIVARLAFRPWEDSVRIVSQPLVALLLILAVVSVTNHMRLGMQTIIEDYVHAEGRKVAALMLNSFFAIAVGLACIYAVLKLSFGA